MTLKNRRPRFTDADRVRIREAKTALTSRLHDWEHEEGSDVDVVNAVEELMVAVKILKAGAVADAETDRQFRAGMRELERRGELPDSSAPQRGPADG